MSFAADTDFRIPLGSWADAFIDFITDTFGFFFDFVRAIFSGAYDLVDLALAAPPFWVIILVAGVLGLMIRGWRFAGGTVVGLVVIVGVDQWENAMDSLALVLVASILAILFSVPLGILSAKSGLASGIIRPILDFMQTMPAFVYLIPALILFRVGVVPGIVATIIFAMAPGVRLTELGIRNVDHEVVEAGQAFGASPWRILRQIQLPLAIFLDRITAALGTGNTPIGRFRAAHTHPGAPLQPEPAAPSTTDQIEHEAARRPGVLVGS
ncbi:proline/glycine betaine ABC transporter permease [Cryobacterium sp.]|uniref:ABC transporter permease n=1 Tax=Cryobacterium sp. TaxID=1926290 RepID=UPI002634B34A|nr:ABC transporter permease subunit [Cryobacterium sp.]MCU1447061.1 transporter, substrate-binding protein [Cryobacterium sp.]